MKTCLAAFLVAAVFLGLTAGCGPEGEKTAKVKDLTISGPYEHKNLSVFLLHGPDRVSAKDFLTLQEAMEKKLVVVHETGNVQELSVENVSGNYAIYIQSGDIVKGGRQDRTLQYDLVLSPKSGKVPLASFCVEQGRWSGRAKESAGEFGSSGKYLANSNLRMANASGQQSAVWEEVQSTQNQLSDKVGEKVNAAESQTSLQLALENKKLKETIEEYTKTLARLPEGKNDVVGLAVAVNGKIRSVDAYSSGGLFRKLWPKLLESAATEAIGDLKKDARFAPPAATDIGAFMTEMEQAKAAAEKEVNNRTRMTTRDSKKGVLLESRDEEQKKSEWLHRAYLAK